MPGTGPAPDHGGNAVALRRVMAALRPMLVATRSAKVERRSNILSRYAGRFTRLPFFGKFESLRADVERWGWMRSALIRVVSVLRRCAGLYIYRINVRPLAARSSPPCLPSGITVRVVLADELLKAADDPDLDLSPDFVRDALARGDMAFGAFEDGRLVGYTWRTFTAAPDRDGLWARVSPPCQYSYKAFTRPSHRRRRIHVAITFCADAYLLERGYAFEVGYMEVNNFASIGVADFLGRRKIGYAGYLKWFGRCIPFRTPAVKKIGAELLELQK
jgi:hypothetical protein